MDDMEYEEANLWRSATWEALKKQAQAGFVSQLSDVAVSVLGIKLVSNCEKCGCDIGAQPKGDALCCSCRYGENSSRGYRNHVAEMDLVDTMSVNASRFRSGSEFWPGVKEEALTFTRKRE